MNWMGNFEVGGHIVTVQVTDEALVDWTYGKDKYLAVASNVLDAMPAFRPDYQADGGIVQVGDRFFRSYHYGDVGVIYHTEQRTSRNGLFAVDCDYRTVIFPHGIRIAEQTAGDGYL